MAVTESWTDKYLRLKQADQTPAPDALDLDQFALAAFLTGNDGESYGIYERAYQSHIADGHIRQAVRCAFWLGLILMNTGQKARGNGWMAKAQRLLSETRNVDCPEAGLLQIPQGVRALYGGHSEKARHLFGSAERIGTTYRDIELIALSRLGQGQTYIWEQDVLNGRKLFDELLVTIETEKVYPVVAGITYCAVIETCYEIRDLDTASAWTRALTRWCADQPDIIPFRGQCLVRRAEMIQLTGEWDRAIKETAEACALLTRPPGEPAAGEAYYRRGELFRLRGKVEDAEVCYKDAAKWGRNPQPGLALLRLMQGRHDDAETSIRNSMLEAITVKQRLDILPAVVTIMAHLGSSDGCRPASDELSALAQRINSPYMLALADHCSGIASFSAGEMQRALRSLKEALTRWELLLLPYETAQAREYRGRAFQHLNDKDNADAEFAAAQWIYNELGAIPDSERINSFIQKGTPKKAHQLTLRELQVLRRVSSGKTNKEIAQELFISDRTVDRHVSNIFNKLNVSTRTEATSVAFKNKLLDFQA